MDINVLTSIVIAAAYAVHNQLGSGFLEKVYENALRLELIKAGVYVAQQSAIHVYYDGQVVGEYFVDLMVEKRLIVEIKAIQKLAPEHEVQLVNYLNATKIEDGLLINFGSSVTVKRKFRTYRPKTSEVQAI